MTITYLAAEVPVGSVQIKDNGTPHPIVNKKHIEFSDGDRVILEYRCRCRVVGPVHSSEYSRKDLIVCQA